MHSESGSNGSVAASGGAARLLLLLIDAYRVALAPLLGGHCRFWPSCSAYAEEAIRRHGARRGVALAARRLLRCHPFTAGGLDPVPWSPDAAAADRSPAGRAKTARPGASDTGKERATVVQVDEKERPARNERTRDGESSAVIAGLPQPARPTRMS